MPLKYKIGSKKYNEWFRLYRKRNAEKLRKYNKVYNKKWRELNGYHNEKKSKKRYPEKEYARMLLNIAVRSGKLVRKNCAVCNLPNSQAHHENYFKPLEVEWLCPFHHKDKHRKIL